MGALAILAAAAAPAWAQTHATERVSAGAGGAQAIGGASRTASVSGDGRYVSFASSATNLVPGDTNGVQDVFVQDRLTKEMSRVSVGPLGVQADGSSQMAYAPSISDDGRYVIFLSNATNLVAGDTNGLMDAFVHDRVTHQTTRVNVDVNGQVLAPAAYTSISGNGLSVSFVAGGQVYAREWQAAGASIVSTGPGGLLGGAESSLSTDGRYVVFDKSPGLGAGVYARDRLTNTTAYISVMPGSLFLLTASPFWPTISSNGRYVAFNAGTSDPANPFADRVDIWLRDRDVDGDGVFDEPGAAVTRLINESAAGVRANDDQTRGWPRITKSGRFVVFSSDASNLLGPGGDTNNRADVFVADLDGDDDGVFFEPGDRRVWRASVASDGVPQAQADAETRIADISDDGRIVVFDTPATNLVSSDTNGTNDVFAFDRFAWTIDDLLTSDVGAPAPQISGNGDWVAFASDSATLVAGDTNGQIDVFVRDRRRRIGQSGAVVRVSMTTHGAQALGGASDQPSISGDGRFVVFRSAAANLVSGDTNGVADIFLHDRDVDRDGVFDELGARATYRVNVTASGAQASGAASHTPRISPDARWIVFASAAVNLSLGGNGTVQQVYLKERLTGLLTCISQTATGTKANADAVTPVVANYGTVAFATTASNLAATDTNGTSDVYVSEPFPSGRTLKLVSGVAGTSVPGVSREPSLSTDGLVVAFASSGLSCSGASPGQMHVFAMPIDQDQASYCASRSREGAIGNGPSASPSLANRGASYHLTMTSAANNLIFGDANGVDDVFYVYFYPFDQVRVPPYYPRGLITDLVTRVSLAPDGSELLTASGVSSMSLDGTRVEYERPAAAASPALAAGTVIGRLDGKATGADRGPTPVVTGMHPSEGPESGGTIVTITGSGLEAPEIVPTLSGVALVVLQREQTFIRAATPAGTGIRVLELEESTPGGGKSTTSHFFRYEAGPPCVVVATLTGSTVPAAGGTLDLLIADQGNCGWAVEPGDGWISRWPDRGEGSATVTLTIAPNGDPGQRIGRVYAAGGSVELSQDGAACAPATFAEPTSTLDWAGEAKRMQIRTTTGCPWEMRSTAPDWLRIVDGASGNATQDVVYEAAPNPATTPRTADIEIVGGGRLIVTQTERVSYTLHLDRPTGGRIFSDPIGLDCGPTCDRAYLGGTVVALMPSAESGYAFERWSGACSGSGPCVVTVNGPLSVGAVFQQAPNVDYTLQVATAGSGTVVSSPGGVSCPGDCTEAVRAGTTVTLTPAASPGWTFSRWTGDGCGAVVQMTRDRACTAVFETSETSGVLTVTVTGNGRVTSVGPGIACGGDCTQFYDGRAVVALVATPLPGHTLQGWGGPCGGTGRCLVRVVGPTTVSATFVEATGSPLTLTGATPRAVLAAGGTKVRITGSGFSQAGAASVTLGGIPASSVEVLDDATILAVAGEVPTSAVVAVQAPAVAVLAGDVDINIGGATAVLPAGFEAVVIGGSPQTDTDGDGLSDTFEGVYSLDITTPDADRDPDGDGRTNLEEFLAGTHPQGLYTRYLAEGATGSFFDTRLNLAAPGVIPSTALLRFQTSTGTTPAFTVTVPGEARRTVRPRELAGLASADFSVVVESDVQLGVDRTMFWGDGGYGSHAEAGLLAPATTWYLAEGATHGLFDLFYLIQNPDLTRPAEIRVRFLLPAAAPVVRTYTVNPRQRMNIYVDDVPGLAQTDVSAVVESTNGVPIIVERSMYVSRGGQAFGGGHNSAGVTAPAATWFLAEGATGAFFDTFVLIANPGSSDAELRATYALPDGRTVVRTYRVGAERRLTIWVDGEDSALAATSVATTVTSTNGVPVIVERSMWWPGPELTANFWHEAHGSAGATGAGTLWVMGDGETGGAASTQTYYLVANQSSSPATIRVTLLAEDGAPPRTRIYTVAANSRFTIGAHADFPDAVGTFGCVIESLGSPASPIVVERAMYSNANGVFWAAGTDTLATRVR